MNKKICVSGGFDPLHNGHIEMFRKASQYGDLCVIINSDEWLLRKKGFIFQDAAERKEIIGALRWVTSVVIGTSSPDDNTVCETLRNIRPTYFANGGDRTSENTPEKEVCEELGIEMLWGIGGGKRNSSSELVKRARTPRPWGWYEVLYEGDKYKVKSLTVSPRQQLSLQSHSHRSEHWTVVEGIATVVISGNSYELHRNQSIFVPIGEKHRIVNNTEEHISIVEVQVGEYVGEDDITRYEDIYGRTL